MNTKTLSLSLAALTALPGMALAQGTYLSAPDGNPTNALIVSPGGKIGIGTTSPSSRLTVYESTTNSVTEAARIIQDYSNTDSGTDFIKALDINKYNYNIPDGVTAYGYQIGISPQVYVLDENFAGTIDNQYAIWARTGMRIIGASGARTINNAYGIYIEGLTQPGGKILNHYGVYQEGAGTKNYFEGNVGVGTTAPRAMLEVSSANSGRHSRVDIFKSTGSDSDRASLRIGYDGEANLEIYRMRADDDIFYTSSQVGASQQFTTASGGNFIFNNGNVGIGTTSPQVKLDVNGKINCTVLELTSDRNQKQDFTAVDSRRVLDRLLGLPITTWVYTNDAKVRHLGPMAQDWKAAYPELGSDDKHIAAGDLGSVALAAIQGLNAKLTESLKEKDARLAALEQQLARMDALAARLATVEKLMAQVAPAHAVVASSQTVNSQLSNFSDETQ